MELALRAHLRPHEKKLLGTHGLPGSTDAVVKHIAETIVDHLARCGYRIERGEKKPDWRIP